jgi:uncharacterized protein YdaL
MRHYRLIIAAGATVALVTALTVITVLGHGHSAPHHAARPSALSVAARAARFTSRTTSGSYGVPTTPSPPKPPKGRPKQRRGYRAPTALVDRPAGAGIGAGPRAGAVTQTRAAMAKAAAAIAPPEAVTWGDSGTATTLVLYDTTNTWGWLGELYAIGAGNLATHFGTVTAEPVVDYVEGQVNDYTATIYIGSTYNEPIPQTFLNDVLSTTEPVIWIGDNIWQLTGSSCSSADEAFEAAYGWDPSTSYFDTTDTVASVTYKGYNFTRSTANTGGVLAPHITNASLVNVLATANCSNSSGTATDCSEIAQTTGTSFPWALQSGNLMYLGEVPLSYMTLTDRYLIFADLLFDDLDPTATASHEALVRIEDISPDSSPTNLDEFSSYLQSQAAPFSIALIPDYLDPNGYYNNGVPVSETLAQEPTMVSALKTAITDGATILQHGYTHQYSNVANPFSGVSGDDFEFYRAQCSTTSTSPYNYVSACSNSDTVVEEGPVSGDSQAWAAARVQDGQELIEQAGLPTPTIWTTPQYAASAADYAGIDQTYSVRYEDELFFGGELSGQPIDYSHVFGQFFPYEVHDLYGTTIIPENLGDYEPTALYGNPARTAQEIINEAQLNLAVRQGVASFYIHSDYDPLSVLEQVVTGLKNLGYTFVSPATLMSANG